MGREWPILTIAECASSEPYSTQIGPFGDKLRAGSYTPIGAPVLRGTNVNPDGRFHDDDFVFIDPTWAEAEFEKFVCEADDVILCHKGTLGKIGIIPKKSRFSRYIMGNSMMKVRCDRTKLEPLYLYYWLCSLAGQNYLFSRVSQVGVPQIQRPLSTLREAALPVPPLPEQRAIANILGTLDDKIELNRQTNETLEAMARALFKSWFVDFDPVRAKAEGRQPSGMDAETAKLFPSGFEESELGEIPKGWGVATVGELAVLSGGKQLERDQITADGAIPVFGGAGIMGFSSCHNADGFVISVGRVGAYCGQFFAHRGKAWINNNASLIRPKDDRFAEWLFIALRHADIDVIKKGAAQPFVSNGDVAKLQILWPGEQAIASFSSLLVPLLAAKDANDAQSKALSAIRDALLPRLLSGELPVTADNRALEAQA